MDLIGALAGVAAVLCLLFGARQFSGLATERRRVAAAAAGYSSAEDQPQLDRLDRWFRRTRPGRWAERELALAGLGQRPVVVVLVAAAAGVAIAWVLWASLAPALAVLGIVIAVVGLRAFIGRAKQRRLEAFIVQMPELARVLANATNAGLAINTAIAIAGDELDDPAGAELARVANALQFGTDLETAVDAMAERLPSREVDVLLSTLVVSARSGGSLVTSLRTIADTLEQRKETRREIRTTFAQAVATGYLIIVIGFGMLFLLDAIQPGSVREMTENFAGQIALLVAGGLFAGGVLMIRRMTKVDL